MPRWRVDDDNIIHVEYRGGVQVELHDAQQIVEAIGRHRDRLRMGAGEQHFVLIDDRGVKSVSREARNHFASQSGTTGAVAVVVNSRVGEMIGNFIAMVSRPSYPIKLFVALDEAIKWLKKLRAEAS